MPELKARKQIRLKDYDYSVNGYYFITICSHNRENIFGELNVGAGLASAREQNTTAHNKIKLFKPGQIIDNQWNDIPNQYINIKLDYYIIMPNHIHGILVINNQINREDTNNKEDARPSPMILDIICSFKSKCTVEYIKYIKQNDLNISGKIWQRSFNDHIIRNEPSLNAIREYIANNTLTWEKDADNLMNR